MILPTGRGGRTARTVIPMTDYDRDPDIQPSLYRVTVVYVEEIEAFDEDEAGDKMSRLLEKDKVSDETWTIIRVRR